MVLQNLKTFVQTNFRFKRVLRFAIQDAWISRLLRDAALSWRPGKLLCGLKTFIYRFWEILLSKHSLSQNKYYFNTYEFLKRRVHAFGGKLNNRCFCWFPAAIFAPLKGTQTWRLHTKLDKFGSFFRISRIWNSAQTWFLARLIVFLFSFISQILDFLYRKVSIFIFDGVTVKTTNRKEKKNFWQGCPAGT